MTPRKKEILDYIQIFQRTHGYAPSLREIAKNLGLKSVSTIHRHLQDLNDSGLLKKAHYEARSVSIPKKKHAEEKSAIPLLGKVAAGRPIEALIHDEMIEVVPSMLTAGGEYFALKVNGESMIDEGILDQDIVVIRKQQEAENGQIVVALVDNEATIKKFYRKKGLVELHSANPNFQPFVIEQDRQFKLEGIFCGLIRHPKR